MITDDLHVYFEDVIDGAERVTNLLHAHERVLHDLQIASDRQAAHAAAAPRRFRKLYAVLGVLGLIVGLITGIATIAGYIFELPAVRRQRQAGSCTEGGRLLAVGMPRVR